MKIKTLLFLLIFSLCLVSCGSKETEITGEIFIVTKGADNIKLGAISVRAIPESVIKGHLDGSQTTADRAFKSSQDYYSSCGKYAENLGFLSVEQLEERQFEMNKCYSRAAEMRDEIAAAYFENLPPALAQTMTDSNGKFTLKIPKTGKYVIAASSARSVLDKTEKYYWLVWAEADGKQQQIILSNNNMAGSDSPDSAIKFAE